MTVVLSGGTEVIELCDGREHIVSTQEPGNFIGEIAMLIGTASLVSVRGTAEASEILVIEGLQLRKALAEMHGLGEPIIRAFMMRRERLLRDPEFIGLRILAATGSREGNQIDDFLDKNRIPHRVVDVESDLGRALSRRHNIHHRDLPVLIDGNGRSLRRPSVREVAQVAGLIRPLAEEGETEIFCDLAVVGAGPAGLSAALNAASEGLKTIVLERYAPGGQAGSSSLIENFFGFATGISGGDLTNHAQLQAFRFGAKFSTPSQALSLGFTEGDYSAEIYIEGSLAALRAKCVLIATGAQYRRIDAEGLDDFEGRGVYYAATAMEARLCQGTTVVVAGGGNSAGQAAMFLSESAEKVLLAVRCDTLSKSMSSYLSRRVETRVTIEILFNTEIRRMTGKANLEAVEFENTKTGERRVVAVSSVFSMIGAQPGTSWLPPEIDLDDKGFIKTGAAVANSPSWKGYHRAPAALETSRPGIFAAGDVRSGSVKRCAAAVGEGGMAVEAIHQVLRTYA
jgi:thioredoxin reductase (NADPH)